MLGHGKRESKKPVLGWSWKEPKVKKPVAGFSMPKRKKDKAVLGWTWIEDKES